MRIISQDGFREVEYENCGLSVNPKCCEIEAHTSNTEFTPVMASYSSVEKCRKAMEMLHESYCGNIHIYVDQFVLMAQNYASRPELLKLLNEAVKTVKYFRFPSDDEVEV